MVAGARLLQPVQLAQLHLAVEQRHDLEHAEAAAHQQVDRDVGLLGALVQVLQTYTVQVEEQAHLACVHVCENRKSMECFPNTHTVECF